VFARLAARNVRQRVLVTTSFVHLLNDACFAILYPLFPLIAADLGLSYAQVGLVKTAFSGASSVLQLPAGIIGEWWGEGLVLLVGNAWVGFGLVGMALTGGYLGLLAVALVAGIGGNAQHPLASALVSRAYADSRAATALGTLNFMGDLGKLIGPPIVGLLAIQYGWRAALGGVGALTAALSVMLLCQQRALLPPLPAPVAADRPAGAGGRGGAGHRLGLGLVLLAGGLDNATRAAALTFLPFLLVQRGASLTATSLLFTVIFAAGATGKFACGWLGDRYGSFAVILVTELATGLALIGMLGAAPWTILPLCAALGFALNGTSSVLLDLVARLVPAERRARGYGIYFTAALVSGAVAPFAYGILGDRAGLALVFTTMALLTMAVVPVTLPLRRLLTTPSGVN
jgi:MFS transporter, FSR family, fosmidomycin resistance protein